MPKEPITKDQAANNLDLLRIIIRETIHLNGEDYACCPFHTEATTSFHVFKAKSGRARYHCFGCGAAGDIFDFLNRTKQLSFKASIEFISNLIDRKVIISLPEQPRETMTNISFINQTNGLLDTKDGNKFCEKDCPKYAALREDYEAILEERHIEANPDLETVPTLVNEIVWLKERIKNLETELKETKNQTKNLGGFGNVSMKSNSGI